MMKQSDGLLEELEIPCNLPKNDNGPIMGQQWAKISLNEASVKSCMFEGFMEDTQISNSQIDLAVR